MLMRGAIMPPALTPAMRQSEILLVGRLRPPLACDLAAAHGEDAVRQVHDLVEFDRDEEDADAGIAQRDEPAVDELDRADVDAARRLADEQHLGLAFDLAREHDLLLVAAGEFRCLQARCRRAARRTGPSCPRGRPIMRPWSRNGPRPSRGSSVKPRTALSKASKAGTRPMRRRSSGTCRRPSCRSRCGLCASMADLAALQAASCRGPAGASRRALPAIRSARFRQHPRCRRSRRRGS